VVTSELTTALPAILDHVDDLGNRVFGDGDDERSGPAEIALPAG
jgi:hypothetical protein